MNIFIYREIKIQFHSLSKRLSTLCVFDSLVENQLTRNVCIYFSVLYSVSLVFVSAFMPEPCCFHYDNFLVYFEIGQGEVSSFRILVQDSFGYFCLFCLYMSLGAVFLLLRKIPLKFCSNYICSRRVSLELKWQLILVHFGIQNQDINRGKKNHHSDRGDWMISRRGHGILLQNWDVVE